MTDSSTNPAIPTADQLAASRLLNWHQNGEALLTFENLRSWINVTGLVLFTPRAGQLAAPAPSMVEAVLGAPSANPILADTEQAKSLLARLIAEGVAVPLNLLGTPGETPDFVASAAVFSYIFTLRGDKAWKQPPPTAGALKVSPLALAAYTLLTERVTLSAYDLATQLGKEVTESAVLRALNELWVHLRVLPIPQPDGAATLWEPTSARFTKLMKAGANAGQPSALSALISLYLNTVVVASEEEIETFLSPLAARSRIRDVVHALMSARQLDTIAVEGKTVLHVAGELPGFLAPEGSVLIDTAAADGIAAEAVGVTEEGTEASEGAPRITKFVAKPRKVGTGYVKKPAFGTRPLGPPDRERRPFAGKGKPPASGKPAFTKPWQEEKAARLTASSEGSEAAPARPTPRTPRPPTDRGSDRPTFTRKPAFGAKPSFGSRPSFSRDAAAGRPPRREFAPRPGTEAGDTRSPRKPFVKSARPYTPREGGVSPRPERSDSRPPRRDFAPRESGSADARPPRREFKSRSAPGEGRPSFGAPRKPGPFSPRPPSASGDRKPFTPREGGGPSRFGAPRPPGATDRRARTDGPPFRKFDAPRTGFSGKPGAAKSGPGKAPFAGGKDAGKKPFGKPGFKSAGAKPGKPAGTFDKFKNHAKPFGNRPPARKFRPEEGEPTA